MEVLNKIENCETTFVVFSTHVSFDKFLFKNKLQLFTGSRLANAIDHVIDNCTLTSYGNRESVNDVIVVMTDGRANDQKEVIKRSRKLRKKHDANVISLSLVEKQ